MCNRKVGCNWRPVIEQLKQPILPSHSAKSTKRRIDYNNYSDNHLPNHQGSFVTDKSDSRFVAVRFLNHSYDYRPNWTPLGLIIIINYGLVSKLMIMLITIITTAMVIITLDFTRN